MPHETAAVSAQVLCTPYKHAPCHFVQSHIRKVYACLAVTCHLHFWQNDRNLLRVTAVTRGWNEYRNKSQHRKLTLEKKIHQPVLQGFEPATFQSRIRRSNHWAIPAPPSINSARVYWSAGVYNSARVYYSVEVYHSARVYYSGEVYHSVGVWCCKTMPVFAWCLCFCPYATSLR